MSHHMFSTYAPPLIDMYLERPHIFADTYVRLVCRATWRCWAAGIGRCLHAEYSFHMQRRIGSIIDLPVFRWDMIDLVFTREYTDITEISNMLVHEFSLTSDSFILSVRIHCQQRSFAKTVIYRMEKHDLMNNIKHVMMIFSAFTYTHSLNSLLKSIYKKTHCMISIRTDTTYDEFSVIRLANYISCTYNHNDYAHGACIENHNILEIFEFMKSSRLNSADYLPRYTISATQDIFLWCAAYSCSKISLHSI